MVQMLLIASVLEIAAPFGNCRITVPEFADRVFPITLFGAKPDGMKCTDAFREAMLACERAGGGIVSVPAGRWLTGAVHFRNNCNLRLEMDSVLEFTDDPADYPEVHTTWEGIECYNLSPLLFAYGVTNVAITGSGTIAPRMGCWRTWFARPLEHMKATECLYYWCSTNAPVESRRLLALDRAHMRPHLMQFNRCGNVLLDGFRIRESPFWMIHLYHSENCVVRDLDTQAHGHNNDGIDVDMTKNVLIEKCRFDQGDDGVVLKAGRNADAWRLSRSTENVVIRDCDMVESHSLLGIGSELSGGIRNVWMTRCTVESTWSMLRIKTCPRRGGFVENIWMDHCAGGWAVRVFDIATGYRAQWGAFPDFELRRTRIRNVNVSDCKAEFVSTGVELLGDRLLPPSGIRIRDVRIGRAFTSLSDIRNCLDVKVDALVLEPADSVRLRPRLLVACTEGQDGLDPRESDGRWWRHLQDLTADGCEVRDYAASEGLWSRLMCDVRPGDWVIIPFGPETSQKSDESSQGLPRRIADVRARGAMVIILADRCKAADLMSTAQEMSCDVVDLGRLRESVGKGGSGRCSADSDAASLAGLFVGDVVKRELPIAELFRR